MLQELNFWLIGSGLLLGLLFGILVQRSRLCTLAAVSNWVLMRDVRQIHGYLAALGVAVLGTTLLDYSGLVPISQSIYRSGNVNWLGALGGGAIFGFGAVIAGGCAGRLLVRGAEGSGSALCALGAIALGASACAYGVLEPARISLIETTGIKIAEGDSSLMAILGVPAWVMAMVVVLGCALIVLPVMRRSESTGLVIFGAAIGALVVAGWFATGYLAQNEFAAAVHRPTSLTFAGPLGRSMQFTLSGYYPGNPFYLALLAGVLGGAFASAVAGGAFRWSMPSSQELIRVAGGGLLMGVGAVLAGGCNIGQGLTGMSTLSLSALLAVTGIVAGMRFGLAWLLRAETEEAETSSNEYRESAVNEAV